MLAGCGVLGIESFRYFFKRDEFVTSGGTETAGATGRVLVPFEEVLTAHLQPHPRLGIRSILLCARGTTRCGINGGTVHGGAIGKILVLQRAGYAPHQVPFPGDKTESIAMLEEERIICGISGIHKVPHKKPHRVTGGAPHFINFYFPMNI
ncbi:hypothetical protein LD39_09405 [Halobacillus sp. BBL2006]|nr:hypothetical protein LD39_09405 [Halobacillus sp. BBL2006]